MGFCLLISPEVLAQSPGGLFQEAYETLYHTFTQVRTIVYVTAGFGLIGVAVAAISGKLPWRWLAMISVALFTLAVAEKIVLYVTDESLGNIPESDFADEEGDAEFKIYTKGSGVDFDQNALHNEDSNFINK